MLAVLLMAPVTQADQSVRRLSLPIPSTEYTIEATPDGHRLIIEGFGTLLEPGVPRLPSRIFPVAIPPGAEVVGVTFTAADPVSLQLESELAPAKVWNPIGSADEKARAAEQARFDANYATIYAGDEQYPASPVQLLRKARFRGHELVDIRVTPVAYHPQTRNVLHYTDITVHVDYRLPEQRELPVCESSAAIEAAGRDLIFNSEQASAWCSANALRDPERYEFVIVTTPGLVSSLTDLVE